MSEGRAPETGGRAPARPVPARPTPPPAVTSDTGTGRGMRARLARMGTRGQTTNPVLEPLFRAVRTNHPKADLVLLERAYLTGIGMTEPTLVASPLHDTVEDTPYTLEECRREFGDEVAQLVDGVTKL